MGGNETTEPPVYELGPGRHTLVLAPLPLMPTPPEATVTMRVTNARDSVLVPASATLGGLADRAIPIDTGDLGFPDGTYELRVDIAAAQGLEARTARFPFRVKRMAP